MKKKETSLIAFAYHTVATVISLMKDLMGYYTMEKNTYKSGKTSTNLAGGGSQEMYCNCTLFGGL